MSLPFFRIKRQLQSQLAQINSLTKPKDSPDELMGELFQDVQLRRVFPDGMTFVDLVPAKKLNRVLKIYELEREQPGFSLHDFVQRHFHNYLQAPHNYTTNPDHTLEEHILELWPVLTREVFRDKGSLIALPHPYVVPGGRFAAQWYWDSYFTMVGLAASDRYDLLEGILKNCAYMIRKVGFIPSGNRTYYLGRSQPPFFAHMVGLLAAHQGKRVYVKYLPYMIAEYNFWMKGRKRVASTTPTFRRLVLMPDGSYLNRYYDNKRAPRPESYKEDVETATQAHDRAASQVFLDIRAAAESGWDFSSRWLADGEHMTTIRTTGLIPVDLNCLLYDLEKTIADTYDLLKQSMLARPFHQRAEARKAAIHKYCWSKQEGFYFDYDFVAKKPSDSFTLAGAFPLFSKMATPQQAQAVAHMLGERFLQPGGLTATLKTSPEQWDSPNGWAPLHWVAIQGLRNYGYNDLAAEISNRWIATCETVYKKEGKLIEKYNVVDPDNPAGSGGEYALQDGFGWTNAILIALLRQRN